MFVPAESFLASHFVVVFHGSWGHHCSVRGHTEAQKRSGSYYGQAPISLFRLTCAPTLTRARHERILGAPLLAAFGPPIPRLCCGHGTTARHHTEMSDSPFVGHSERGT